jgi:deoxyadenosine/deoxycytidine kinase
MTPSAPYVVVGGNIATGKSTLVDSLGPALGVDTYPERWQDNPWFGGPPQGAFASQLWFLLSAASANARLAAAGGVQERCIHEHVLVFGAELLDGHSQRLLMESYARLEGLLPCPQLLVFLHASPQELERRVRRRARPQESDLTLSRLEHLDRRYGELRDGWTRSPVVEIDTELLDLRNPSSLADAVGSIARRLS